MADVNHVLTLQFKHKMYGNEDKTETSRAWIERQLRAILHNNDLVVEIVQDEVLQTETLPGIK